MIDSIARDDVGRQHEAQLHNNLELGRLPLAVSCISRAACCTGHRRQTTTVPGACWSLLRYRFLTPYVLEQAVANSAFAKSLPLGRETFRLDDARRPEKRTYSNQYVHQKELSLAEPAEGTTNYEGYKMIPTEADRGMVPSPTRYLPQTSALTSSSYCSLQQTQQVYILPQSDTTPPKTSSLL